MGAKILILITLITTSCSHSNIASRQYSNPKGYHNKPARTLSGPNSGNYSNYSK